MEFLDRLTNWVDLHWRKLMWAYGFGFFTATFLIWLAS